MSTHNTIETLRNTGELDPAYGIKGTTLVDGSNVVGLAVWTSEGPDKGKVVGVASQGAEFKLFRLDTNGELDKSFGADKLEGVATGYTTWSFGNSVNTTSTVRDLMIVDNDKIVLTGHVRDNPPSSPSHPAAARFNANGTPDLTFGRSAVFTFQEPAPVTGKTIGSSQTAAGKPKAGSILFSVNSTGLPPYRDWGLLIQLTPAGELDLAFNDRGYVFFQNANESTSTVSCVTQANGKIVVAGSTATKGFLAGFTATGKNDELFGTGGFTTFQSTEGSIELRRLVLQPDQKPVAIGMLKTGSTNSARHGWVIRTLDNGTADIHFNGGSPHITRVPFQGSQWNAGNIDSSGAIVVVGELSARGLSLVGRITADGKADPTFGVNGLSNPQAPDMPNFSSSVALQADNDIVVGGRKGSQASVSRFQA